MHDLAYFQKRREAHVPLAALVAGLNCILPGILILNGLYVRPELTGLAIMLSFGGVLADVQLSCIGMLRACFRVLLEYTPTGVRNPGEPLGCTSYAPFVLSPRFPVLVPFARFCHFVIRQVWRRIPSTDRSFVSREFWFRYSARRTSSLVISGSQIFGSRIGSPKPSSCRIHRDKEKAAKRDLITPTSGRLPLPPAKFPITAAKRGLRKSEALRPSPGSTCLVATCGPYGAPKASRTFPFRPSCTPGYPEPAKTIPPAIVGPEDPMEPPVAGMPFTVSKSRSMSKLHRIFPSLAERARRTPSQPPEKSTPGMMERAASCPPWRPESG